MFNDTKFIGLVSWKIEIGTTPYFMGRSMVSGEDCFLIVVDGIYMVIIP